VLKRIAQFLGVSAVTKLQNILCPVDFSDSSRKALCHAAAVARRYRSDLTVLYVDDLLPDAARAELNRHAAILRSPEEELRCFVRDAGTETLTVNVRSVAGDVVDGILDQARVLRADLIVMGTRGRSGMARVILGSVTDRVLRQACCPVMTIPPTGTDPTEKAGIALFDRILCTSDFSPSCKKALDVALWLGEQEDAQVILLNVIQWPTSFPAVAAPPAMIDAFPTRSELAWNARDRLKAVLPSDALYRGRSEIMVRNGKPSDVILRVAADKAVTLIVMGVTSRGAIDQMIFGSTTRSVIQSAHCPVLSVRAHEFDEDWPRAHHGSPAALEVRT
jgi:nucleotide-binding universal stress UspA family protein